METVVRSIAQLRYEELRKTESNKKALILIVQNNLVIYICG